MKRGIIAVGLLLAVLTAASAAPASAVAPVSLGTGAVPAVAVDAAGTGHFVWSSDDSTNFRSVLHYCSIPLGVLACQHTQQLAVPAPAGTGYSQPRIFVRPSDGAIIVIDSRCCFNGPVGSTATWAIVSTDGGLTWQAPVEIGTGFDLEDDIALTPDGGSVDRVIGGTSQMEFQRDPLAGPAQTAQINLDQLPDSTTGNYWYYGQVAYLSNGDPVVVMGDLANLGDRVYTAGDINTETDWAPNPPALIGEGQEDSLTSGPAGVFVSSLVAPGIDEPVQLRSLTAAGTFSAPTTISQSGFGASSDALFEDGAGTLHAVWGGGGNLFYSRRSTGGFTKPFELVTATPTSASIIDLRVATNSAHEGWAVWDDNTDKGIAHAVPLTLATVAPPVPRTINSILPNLTCLDRRRFVIPVRQLKSVNGNVTNAVIYINHKKIKTVTGKNITHVTITRLPKKGTYVVKVVTLTTKHFQITSTRTYRGCRKGQRSDVKHRAGK
jgi:hypothetical protein